MVWTPVNSKDWEVEERFKWDLDVWINLFKCIQQSAGISFFPHILPLFPLKEDELSFVGTNIDTLLSRHKHQLLFFIREQFLKTRETTTWEVLNTAVTRKVLNPISACHPDWNNALPILSSKELSNPWSSSFYQFHLFPCCQSSNFSKCALWSYFLKSNAQNALEIF